MHCPLVLSATANLVCPAAKFVRLYPCSGNSVPPNSGQVTSVEIGLGPNSIRKYWRSSCTIPMTNNGQEATGKCYHPSLPHHVKHTQSSRAGRVWGPRAAHLAWRHHCPGQASTRTPPHVKCKQKAAHQVGHKSIYSMATHGHQACSCVVRALHSWAAAAADVAKFKGTYPSRHNLIMSWLHMQVNCCKPELCIHVTQKQNRKKKPKTKKEKNPKHVLFNANATLQ